MRAIQFEATTGRYLFGLALRNLIPGILLSGFSCTFETETAEPTLPAEDWVKIKTRYGGICGTDMKSIHLDISMYYSPLASTSFILGHENVGTIVEVGPQAGEWQAGERVVVEPTLWCKPRGFDDLCEFCAKGEINHCLRTTEGDLSPGLQIGACADTGGSWGPYFVAHESQLYRLPDTVTDENAVLIEPFACGVHAAIQHFPKDDETVLIVGAGTIGLCTIAALRGLGSQARLIVLARYPHQVEAAKKLGADHVIMTKDESDLFAQIGELTNGQVKKPILGKEIMVGGADVTFECVGSQAAVDDALRLSRSRGKVAIAGAPGEIKKLDWTPLFYQELQVSGAYIFNHAEEYEGKIRKTYDIAIELMASGKVDLGWMVTHRFALDDFKQAIRLPEKKSKDQVIKVVYEFA
jgi:threonine dehydrogenase-like Zn-dependent dehydrogenase